MTNIQGAVMIMLETITTILVGINNSYYKTSQPSYHPPVGFYYQHYKSKLEWFCHDCCDDFSDYGSGEACCTKIMVILTIEATKISIMTTFETPTCRFFVHLIHKVSKTPYIIALLN